MTLDDRIIKDLKELYNGGSTPGVIKDALCIDGLVKAKPGMTSFATKALPGYYTGKRKAQTVMVMLNPGIDVGKANSSLMCDLCKHSMKNAADIASYHRWCEDYGHIDNKRQDNFDLKQAFFLHHWNKTGISLPAGLSATPKSSKQILLDAKEAVLCQKLQLELIPYASSSFSRFEKTKLHLITPFVDTLLEEIFSSERKYVIFCSRKFTTIFREYNNTHKATFNITASHSATIPGCKIKCSCSIIHINYHSMSIKALIAHTFPSQALPNAYNLMEQYGKFCYDTFIKYK